MNRTSGVDFAHRNAAESHLSHRMSGAIAIYVVIGILAASAWHYGCQYVSRRRASKILRWVENAIGGEGHVTGLQWIRASRFLVTLRLLSGVFRSASLVVELAPWESPLELLTMWCRRRQETVTFQADLDLRPSFSLQVLNQRWYGRTHKGLSPQKSLSSWDFEQAGPFVLSTGGNWRSEITGMISALLATREQDVLSIAFQRVSPHFSATLPLSSFELNRDASSNLLETLRELATVASASQR